MFHETLEDRAFRGIYRKLLTVSSYWSFIVDRVDYWYTSLLRVAEIGRRKVY